MGYHFSKVEHNVPVPHQEAYVDEQSNEIPLPEPIAQSTSKSETILSGAEGCVEHRAISLAAGEVVIRAERGGGNIVLQRDLECTLHESDALFGAALRLHQHYPFRSERLGENFRKPHRFGDRQRVLEPIAHPFATREEKEPPELCSEGCQVFVGPLRGKDLVGAFHVCYCLLYVSLGPRDFAESGRYASGCVGVT